MPDENFEMWRDIAAGQQRHRTEERLENIEKLLEKQQTSGVTKCPYCDGDLSKIGVEICKHCRKELNWYEGVVYKDGEIEQAKVIYNAWKFAREQRSNRLMVLQKRVEHLKYVQQYNTTIITLGFLFGGIQVALGIGNIIDEAKVPGVLCIGFGIAVIVGCFIRCFSYAAKNDALGAHYKIEAAEEEIRRL